MQSESEPFAECEWAIAQPNTALELTPQSDPKIGAILKVGN